MYFLKHMKAIQSSPSAFPCERKKSVLKMKRNHPFLFTIRFQEVKLKSVETVIHCFQSIFLMMMTGKKWSSHGRGKGRGGMMMVVLSHFPLATCVCGCSMVLFQVNRFSFFSFLPFIPSSYTDIVPFHEIFHLSSSPLLLNIK